MDSDIKPTFALTVTDVLPDDMICERLENISRLSNDLRHMNSVNIRCDSMDPGRFASVVGMAGGCGLDIILEAMDLAAFSSAIQEIPDMDPLLIMDPETFTPDIRDLGKPFSVSSRSADQIPSLAEELGPGHYLDLRPFGMHDVLEAMTRLSRLDLGPAMYRGNSGEYALTCSTVAVLRGARLVILDDMDEDSCRILNDVMTNFGEPLRCA